jgi:hypothetical protein
MCWCVSVIEVMTTAGSVGVTTDVGVGGGGWCHFPSEYLYLHF